MIDPKRAEIEKIVQQDKVVFEAYAENPNNRQKIDIPPEVLRSLSITRRLLSLSHNPANVGIKVAVAEQNWVQFFTAERRPETVSDTQSFNEYVFAQRLRRLDMDLGIPPARVSIPENVDEFHYQYFDEVGKSISLNDYVFNMMTLSSKSVLLPERQIEVAVAHLVEYGDKSELRGIGLGSNVLRNLRSKIKALGFDAISLQGLPRNIKFWTDKMGYVLLDDLPPQLQGVYPFIDTPEEYCVNFLNPTLRRQLRQSRSNN